MSNFLWLVKSKRKTTYMSISTLCPLNHLSICSFARVDFTIWANSLNKEWKNNNKIVCTVSEFRLLIVDRSRNRNENAIAYLIECIKQAIERLQIVQHIMLNWWLNIFNATKCYLFIHLTCNNERSKRTKKSLTAQTNRKNTRNLQWIERRHMILKYCICVGYVGIRVIGCKRFQLTICSLATVYT